MCAPVWTCVRVYGCCKSVLPIRKLCHSAPEHPWGWGLEQGARWGEGRGWREEDIESLPRDVPAGGAGRSLIHRVRMGVRERRRRGGADRR